MPGIGLAARPGNVLRSSIVGLIVLLSSFSAVACQPPSETTRESGALDASGHALVHATTPAGNHHWSVDVTMRGATEGTYVLIFSTAEPSERSWFAIPPNDPALRCASARARGCTIGDRGDIVGLTTIGPGGTGTLRAAFDGGAGGWLQLLHVEAGPTATAPFDLRFVSEALSKDEEAYRFTVEQVR